MRRPFFIILIFSLFSFEVASETLSASLSVEVNKFGVCRVLSNTSSKSYFVPTGISADWSNFLTHLPAGVSAVPCITYAWTWSGWGACTGGSGSWSYSAYGSCTGGSAAYGAWGACSVACGGGTQYRTCSWLANSGARYRSPSCNITANSGTAYRTVECRSSTGVLVSDAMCAPTPKPATSQSCTPTSTTVCGAQLPLSEACTPIGVPTCAGANNQPCNTQSCEPCPGYNACNPTSTCTYFYDVDFSDPQGCIVTSGKYCLNGAPVYDAYYADDCTGTYYNQSGVACTP